MQGKVRDMYALDPHLVIVTTDRQSAFDRLLAAVPYKVRLCLLFLRRGCALYLHECKARMPTLLGFQHSQLEDLRGIRSRTSQVWGFPQNILCLTCLCSDLRHGLAAADKHRVWQGRGKF